ncbi:MAG: right-handed parallel beta-helix repeat-containing protein [Polyangiaceae bacterium]
MSTPRRADGIIALVAAVALGCGPTTPNNGVPSSSPSDSSQARPTSTTSAIEPPFKPSSTACVKGRGRDYPVGPTEKYKSLADVPFESLEAGDTVRIHYRPEPYREKLWVGGVGKADAPIRVCGVKGPNGELPILEGSGATTRKNLPFPFDGHQARGLIVVGWRRGGPWQEQPEHIVIEGLELRGASPPNKFIDKAGTETAYVDSAAGIFVQRASHVTIRGCVIHENANGLFVGSAGNEELTRDVLIEDNEIFDNGIPDSFYQHNVYNEASGVVYQFNRFRSPRAGKGGVVQGGNIKERSAGVVVRYNWIENGAHLLDIVDSQEARDPNVKEPTFHETFVYGNVLVRGPVPSGSMVHYGGDSGLLDTYRKGKLHFFQNTVVVENANYRDYDMTAVFQISTNDELLESVNNVYASTGAATPLKPIALLGARDGVCAGQASFAGDWIQEGIAALDGLPGKVPQITAVVSGFDGATRGDSPGFVALDGHDYRPGKDSPLGPGVELTVSKEHAVLEELLIEGGHRPRPAGAIVGAFSRATK